MLDINSWDKYVRGFTIQSATLSSTTRFWFVLTEITDSPHRDYLPNIRFLSVDLKKTIESRFHIYDVNHFNFTTIAFHNKPQPEVVAVDSYGNVYSYDTNGDREEEPIRTELADTELLGVITRIVQINNQLFATALDRRIFLRCGRNTWTEITNKRGGIPYALQSLQGKSGITLGFNDISAFSDNDIYAIGGQGDIWHFDGSLWKQCPFPTNELLATVCCAGDGNVYITGNMGSVWKGRKDKWKHLLDGKFSTSFKSSEWFAGKLWCGSDYGLWVLEDDHLIPPENMPTNVQNACGLISISPDRGYMLTTGPHGASVFDGKKWELLFSSFSFSQEEKFVSSETKENNINIDVNVLLNSIGHSKPTEVTNLLSNPKLDKSIIKDNSYKLLLNAIFASQTYPEYQSIIQQLLDMGADPDIIDAESGISARTIAKSLGITLHISTTGA